MKTTVIALALGTMLTVEQRDVHRSTFDHASAAISADGRFVAFITYSRLVPADMDDEGDVYVLDRNRQDVTLESANTGAASGDASHPAISGDGRFVVFEHAAAVVLRDRHETLTMVIGEGHHPSITQDGERVLYSAATVDSVVDADTNGAHSDVYAFHVRGGHTDRVSVGLTGLDEAKAASIHPSPSSDGRFVAFASRLPMDAGRRSVSQVFVRDTQRSTTRHLGSGWEPSMSGDGRFVAFVKVAGTLPQIVLADLQTGQMRTITTSTRRGLGNGASVNPKISSNGRFIAFQSEATDLVDHEDFNLLWDVFLFDRMTGVMRRVSGDPDEVWMEPSGGPSIDAHGTVVAFSSRHPTDAADKRNDFDLYVAEISGLTNVVNHHKRPEDQKTLSRSSLALFTNPPRRF